LSEAIACGGEEGSEEGIKSDISEPGEEGRLSFAAQTSKISEKGAHKPSNHTTTPFTLFLFELQEYLQVEVEDALTDSVSVF